MPIKIDLKNAIIAAIETAYVATDQETAKDAWAEAIANAISYAVEEAIQTTTVNYTLEAGGNTVTGTIDLQPNIT